MSLNADARRMQILETLRDHAGLTLEEVAERYHVDERTARRDIECLRQIVTSAAGLDLRRGRIVLPESALASDELAASKAAIARAVVDAIPDGSAVALTAGSTILSVARELRRRLLDNQPPRDLIVFASSLPALQELVAAGISTGVLGEVYNAEDTAFYSQDYHGGFHPGIAVAGASGIVIDPVRGVLELYSQRADEAAFLKQLLAPVPEIVVASHAGKLGHRHPWQFAGEDTLAGKTVRIATSKLTVEQREAIRSLETNASFKLSLVEVIA